MRTLSAATALAAILTLGACAPTAPLAPAVLADADAPDAGIPGADVAVTRDGDQWTVDYTFSEDAPVWAFIRSSLTMEARQPWRPADWTVVTPGVVLERVGHLDVLRTLDGGPVPRHVRLQLAPRAHNLEADYPVLAFTDGSVALFSGAFDVFALPSLDVARDLPEDLNGQDLDIRNARITWQDRSGPVLVQGERQRRAVTEDGTLYVLFGQTRMKEAERIVTVADPQLPAWISAAIEGWAPGVADYYARRLGPGQTDRPTIMASWGGPTPGLQSMGGSVLSGLIVMSFEGIGNAERSDESAAYIQWFIGHESAHFWLGQTVRYERSRDSWITEGGADLMAVRATKALAPSYDALGMLQQEVDDCAAHAVRPIEGAAARGDHRAFYACGAVFALVAERAQFRATGGDWFDFLKPLIDANRADGVLTRDEWLDALDAVSGDASLRRDMERLLDEGSPQAAEVVAGLLERSGVALRREGGKVVLGQASPDSA
ncbi:MAG: hypothetical protein KKC29_09995 [Alphaproteobacteria bacterium]|jgi:hypothetical protein|nr:hypothetical protein [Alphaproteobacteria bacterium]MBU2041959.1 hypothetical protein [Alphaproteobacteria bacterium]MBU2125113.1 hypothetical protein [Alphaproteobacteria bacterium]MBU2207201.1 hypothetical protein [Alphaproteobacteria bacterium]MBU2291417.1 hypothetical protein [Alphaproteobacteria bacterium]